MPSPFHSIELASRALRAFQRGIDVTGHNIANVNTRGYSRQTVEFTETDPTTFRGMTSITLGTGVTVASVNRIRDVFLDNRIFDMGGEQGRFHALSSGLANVDPIFNETAGSGISSALNAFFNAWSSLASNPNQPAALMTVQQTGQTLAAKIRGAYRDLSTLESQFSEQIRESLQEADRLSQRIYELNVEIRARTAAGETPGDLFDQRDLAIEDLSKIVDVNIQRKQDGTINVYSNGFTLVDDVAGYAIPKSFDASTYTLTDGSRTVALGGGSVYGLMEASNRATAYRAELDTLANTLRTEINAAHASGTNANGTTGINFFNDVLAPPQTGAIDFDLSAEVKADIRNISSGTSGSSGDGGLALAISQMRDQQSGLLSNRTFGEFYSELVATMGRDSRSASASLDTAKLVVQQIDLQRQSVSGVSLDDEMATMLRFQRSYQAAAKALSIFDEVTEDLINMVR
jgi:flagellar hook-associated protein 1 FlgK